MSSVKNKPMSDEDNLLLEKADLSARLRLAVWALVREKPERMRYLREAAAVAVRQVEAEVFRRGADLRNGHCAALVGGLAVLPSDGPDEGCVAHAGAVCEVAR